MSSTDPAALLLDLTIAQRAELWEAANGVGDYWWLSVLKALTGATGSDTGAAKPNAQNVRWF